MGRDLKQWRLETESRWQARCRAGAADKGRAGGEARGGVGHALRHHQGLPRGALCFHSLSCELGFPVWEGLCLGRRLSYSHKRSRSCWAPWGWAGARRGSECSPGRGGAA